MKRPHSISRKYALWYSALSLAILSAVLLSIVVMSWKSSDVLRESLRNNARVNFQDVQYTTMRNLSEYLRQHIAPSLYQLNIEHINRLINDLRQGMPIKSFRITDASRKVLTDGTTENQSYGTILQFDTKRLAASPVLIQKTEEGYRATFWIGMQGYTVGFGEIIFSEDALRNAIVQQDKAVEEVWQDFRETFLPVAILGIVISGIISVIISIVISRNISLPLVQLHAATSKVADGDLTHRVAIQSDDEIGELAGAFNRMVEDLQRRTRELAATNRSLQLEIEERIQIEKTLAAEKERISVTLHNIGDGVITTDVEGSVLLMNRAAEELTGWSREEAMGRPVDTVIHIVNEAMYAPSEMPVNNALHRGVLIESSYDALLIDRNGSRRNVAFRCAPLRDSESTIIGAVLALRDITEKRKMEAELLKIQKLESIGVLAGGIAHDFNNLLTGILGNISLSKMYVEQESKAFSRLEEAEKATVRAKDLTQQLLTFSKGGAPIKKVISMGELMRDSAGFALRGAKVKCEFCLSDDLWLVEIDAGQINQVISNLVINAKQAMPDGGLITIRAENISVGPQSGMLLKAGNYIKVSISDQGVGILQEHLPRIFDPYFSTKEKGEGLGLATTHSIIKSHGGYISVDSEVGTGTTFFFYLPASQKEIAANKPENDLAVSGKGRILVMDDEEMVCDVAQGMLQTLGYSVESAHDGNKAIELFQSARESGMPFSAVIMDLTIPGGMGGEEAVKKLKEIDPGVKAIVSSGYSNDPIMADFKEYGFCDIVTKPYNLQQLSTVVSRVLQGAQS